ncbi:unnamed protein product [Rotaria sordida]|uniref:Uncharacterized protein n=2 Tax=Rotaria sordida TaxID=392033 RepID=A0A819PCG2_9BILA|nr:unnamed protein product [Rotaria sordida]
MPRNLTKFNTDWLHRVDSNNDSVNIWLKKGSTPTTCKCSLCQTGDLSCGNQGWKAIEQHMNINKHKEILRQWKQNAKFRVLNQARSDSADSSTSTSTGIPILDANTNKNKPLTLDDQVTKAEILWSLKVAQKGLSYNLCNELNELFSSMFPDSSIAGNFSIQADKMSYVISHGLGPYFKKKLIEDVKKADKFVLIFDEQMNNQNKKQLDMLLRYWSNEKQCVVNRFYKSIILLGHAYAKTIRDIIIESFATDGLNLNKLLMLGRDNPNINISLENLIDVEMKKQGGCLLTIGSCNIHIIHNAFKNGILSSKWYVDSFCLDLYSWFKCSPARQEDYKNVSEDIDSVMEKAILYFSITRWVLLGKVIDRILNQWDILCDYFLCFLPEKQPVQIRENKRYESIKLVLSSNFSKKNLPLNNMLLRDLQVLDYLSRTDRSSGDRIIRVARNIPNLLDDREIDKENRSLLSESSINSLRLVYDGVKLFGSGSAHKSCNYRESLIAAKLAVAIHNNNKNNNKIIHNDKQQHLEEEKVLLDKQKTLAHQMKEAEYLIDEGTNRLEGALKNGAFSEVHAAKLLIDGGREKLTSINEQQQQLTNELDKLRLKRKNALLHEQSINKKLKPIQQNQHNIMNLIDST